MSRSIDERIVEMRFDNALFEKNVATSIGSLEKLKMALDFSGATDSFNRIEQNINAADFSKLSSNIQAITDRFSTFGIAGMTVIQDLTRAAEGLGIKMYNATIGQIKSGGWTRATNIDKAKFAIEGLGYAWDDLKGSIDQAVTDTRFGFDEAATAASQLVASNVAIGTEMDNALKSIANVASQTGDEYSSIAHIYTTVAGNGKLMTEQLNMFSYRGLNAAALIGKALNKTEAEVREMTTKGQIDFKTFSDAMNTALGDGAKRANDTFEGSLANMKAALSRIGQPFAESYRKYMPPVFNNLKDKIKEIKNALAPIETRFDDFAKRASDFIVNVIQHIDLTWVDKLVAGISKVYDSMMGIGEKATPMLDVIKDKAGDVYNFFLGIYEKLYPAASKVKETTNKLSESAQKITDKLEPFLSKIDPAIKQLSPLTDKTTDMLNKVVTTTDSIVTTAAHVDEMAKRVINGEFGKGQARFDKLEEAGENWKIVQNRVNEMLGCNYRYEVSQEEVNATLGETNDLLVYNTKAVEKQKSLFEKFSDWVARLGDMIGQAFAQVDMEYVIGRLSYVIAGITAGIELIGKTVGTVVDAALGPFMNVLIAISYLILDAASSIGEWILNLRNMAEATGFFDKLHSVLVIVFDTISIIATDATRLISMAFSAIGTVLGNIGKAIMGIWDKVQEAFTNFKAGEVFDKLVGSFENLKARFNEAKEAVFGAFHTEIEKLRNANIKLPKIDTGKIVEKLEAVSDKLTGFFTWLSAKLDVNKINGVFSTISGAISNVYTIVSGALVTAFKGAGAAIGFVWDKIETLAKSLRLFFVSLKESEGFATFRETLTVIGERFGALKESASQALDEIFKKLKEAKSAVPTDFIQNLATTVGNVLSTIATTISNLLSKIDIAAVIHAVSGALSVLWNVIKTAGRVVIAVFVTALVAAVGILSVVTKLIVNAVIAIRNFVKVIRESEGFKSFKENLSEIGERIKAFKDIAIKTIKNIFSKLKGTKKSLPTNVIKKFGDTVGNALKKVSDVVLGFLSKINIEAVINSIAKGLSKVWKVLIKVGKVVASVIVVGIKTVGSVLKGLIKVFQSAVKAAKEFWASFKESETFGAISKGFDTVKEKALTAKDKIVDFFRKAFTNDETGEFEFPKLNTVVVKEKLIAFWEWVKEKFFAAKAWLEEKISTLTGKEFHFPELNLEPLQKKFEEVKNWFVDLFTNDETGEFEFPTLDLEGISEQFDKVKEWFTGIFTNEETGEFELNFDNVKEAFDEFITWLQEKVDAIKELLASIFGTDSKDKGKSVENQNSEDQISLFDRIKEVLPALQEVKKAISTIASILLLIQSFKAALGILEALFNLGGLIRQAKGALRQIKGVIKAYKREIKASARELNARALLEVAAAIGIVAYAFTQLGKLSWDQVEKASACIVVITGALAILIAVIGHVSESGDGLTTFQEVLTTALTGIGNGLKKVGAGLAKIGIAAIIAALTFAVYKIIEIIKELTDYPWSDAKNGLKIVAAVLAELVIAVAILNRLNTRGFGGKVGAAVEIVAFALAVKSICNTLASLSDEPLDKLKAAEPIVITLMAVLAVCVGLMDLMSNDTIWQRIGSAVEIVALALGLKLIAGALVDLADVPVDKLAAARNALTLITLAMAVLVASISSVADSTSGNIGGSALAFLAVVGVIAEIVGSFYILKDIDMEVLDTIGGSLSKVVLAIAAMMYVVNEIVKSGASLSLASLKTIFGEAGIALVITSVIGLLASFIGMKDGAADFMNDGADVLEAFGAWIGKFIGGLIGGILDAIGDQIFGDFCNTLLTFPTYLDDFLTLMDPVLEKLSNIDTGGANALLDVIGVIAACFGAELLGSFTDWLLDKDSLEDFSGRLETFGYAIITYSAIVDGRVNESAVQASANAGKMLADLEKNIPNTGGALAGLLGDNRLDKFGDRLVPFGEAIASFSEKVDGKVNETAVQAATNAGMMLAALENELTKGSGVLAFFTGTDFSTDNLKGFASRILAFGRAIRRFSGIVDGHINETAVTAAANAGEILNKLETALTTQDGILSILTGDSGIDDFGGRLERFGGSMVMFSDMITGKADANGGYFDAKAVEAALDTLGKLWDFVERAEGTNDEGAPPLTNFWESLTNGEEAILKLKNFYEMLGADVLSTDTLDASGAMESFKEAGNKLATSLMNGISSELEKTDDDSGDMSLTKAVSDAFDKSISENETLLKDVKKDGVLLAFSFVDGLKLALTKEDNEYTFPSFAKEVVKVFQDMTYKILSNMSGAEPTFKTRGEGWMTKLRDGINAYRVDIINLLTGIPTSVLTNYSIKNSFFYSAGANWMANLSSGIADNIGGIYTMLNNLATDAANIMNGATAQATQARNLMFMGDGGVTDVFPRRSMAAAETVANVGLRAANTLSDTMDMVGSSREMQLQPLMSLSNIQNGTLQLTRAAGSSMDAASQSLSQASSLISTASMSRPVVNQVYVRDQNDMLEAMNGMRRDIKVLTDNMANMQMVLDSGVLIGQLTPGMDISLGQRARFKGRWA